MKSDTKHAPSRREFIQLASAAAGALMTLSVLPSEGKSVADGSYSSSETLAGSAWRPVDPADDHSTVREAHPTLKFEWHLGGDRAAAEVEVEGEAGFRSFTHPAGNTYVNRNVIGAVVGVQPFSGTRLSVTAPGLAVHIPCALGHRTHAHGQHRGSGWCNSRF